MNIYTTYECEYCGKKFYDERDCLLHEQKHLFKNLFDYGSKFYTKNGAEVLYDEKETLETFCDKVFGIVIKNESEAAIIDDIYDEAGYSCPFKDNGINPKKTQRIIYNDNSSNWEDADELISNIKAFVGEK